MKTQELINTALLDASTDGVTLYWDSQDPKNEGPAYRILIKDEEGNLIRNESGPLDHYGWSDKDGNKLPSNDDNNNYQLSDYFRGPYGAYCGPDSDGVYPRLEA